MFYIIADDLTGANDTGVQFTKKGYNSKVSIFNKQSTIIIPDNLDVFVVDTETRELKSKIAREKLRNILKKLNIDKNDMIYKKVDSTLRGNVGDEIEEIMNILKKDICVFSPSFPSHKRITIGGYLVVDEEPLGSSEYSSNNLKQEENSFIPFLLKKQTDFSVGQIDLKDVVKGQKTILSKINKLYQKGNKIIVIDSTSEQHLADIFSSGLKFDGLVLFSGSAGLANHFPNVCNKNEDLKINIENNKSPVIVVAGSRNSILEDQINYIKNKLDFYELKIDLEQILSNKDLILDNYTTKCIQIIRNKRDLVIHTNAIYNEKKLINKKLMLKHNLSFRELEIYIKTFLGELTAKILKNSCVRNLILTGGDVALGVCKELNIYNMNIVDELLPGIPLAIANYKNYKLNIITKAGGFGKEDTLYNLINKLKNY
ncbi:four-carbon acid sugar kinase family protein [Candidatus Atribacteria bacterium 1244-E10-H5-B2]|nr:MAG: four-carbon acid sugar kinase family protein [Candidatus Atribacteria bacterium 1244-E10-H5-B2]